MGGQQIRQGKIAFLQLRDRTSFCRYLLNFIEKFGEEVGLGKFDHHQTVGQVISVFVIGIVKEDERQKFGCELGIIDIEVIGESKITPISKRTLEQTFVG